LKIINYVTAIFVIVVIFSCIGEIGSSSNTNYSKIINNDNKGYIILFSQNYSEVNVVPDNLFIGKIGNTSTFDNLYSKIYGKDKSEIFLENSMYLKYTTSRNSPLIPYSLLSFADIIARSGMIRWVEYLIKPVNIVALCNDASVPLVDYLEEPKLDGSLYICNFTPMVRCTYEISMNINTDDQQSFEEIDSPGSKLIMQKIGNNTLLKSFFQTDSKNVESKTLIIGNNDEPYFKILFDGDNKTNTIYSKNGTYIVTPFYDLDRQKLPYVDFSNGYIKFSSYIIGKGTYLDVDIYGINQKSDRKFITSIGNSKMIAFGLDGPYPRNLTGWGIDYLNSRLSN